MQTAIIFDESEQRRFWEKVRKGAEDECWTWTATTKGVPGKQYGNFTVKRDGMWKQVGAHRVSYEYAHGKIPPGLFVCHRCDNMLCVNPSHLFLGTALDNNLDMKSKGRTRCGEAHWNAKISDAQVRSIIERARDGESQGSIGRSIGITQSTVSRIISGESRGRQPDVDPYLAKALRAGGTRR